MRLRRLPNGVWLAWCLAVALSFAVLETVGILTKAHGDTLSERTRERLGIQPRRPWRWWAFPAFAAVLAGFVIWFLPHIRLGIWGL